MTHFAQALVVRQMASHLTREYFGIQRSLWSTQVLWLQNKPKSSPLHQHVRQMVIVLICCVCVWRCASCPNISIFGCICPKDIVPEVLWFGQMQLCKPKQCCHVLFREKMFSFLGVGNCSKRFPLVNNLPHSIVDLFPPWHCVNTQCD